MGRPQQRAVILTPNAQMPSTGAIAAVISALIVGLVLGVAVGGGVDAPAPVPPTSTTSASTSTTSTTIPSTSEHPDRDSVGVPDGVVLQTMTNNVVTVDGTVIDGALIRGGLVVRADDVTVRNSRIEGDRRLVVECDGCTNLVVEASEIVGVGDRTQGCVGRTNFTLRDSLVVGCIDGVKALSNTLIEGNWIGDLRRVGSSHNDGIQSTGGDSIVIRRNTIVHATGGQTSAIKLTSENQPLTNAVIDGNRLISSTCRAVYFTAKDPWPAPTGQIVGNIVSGHTCPDWLALDSGPDQIIDANEVVDGGAG